MKMTPQNIILTIVGFVIIASCASTFTDIINITTGNTLVDAMIPIMVGLFFVGAALSFLNR